MRAIQPFTLSPHPPSRGRGNRQSGREAGHRCGGREWPLRRASATTVGGLRHVSMTGPDVLLQLRRNDVQLVNRESQPVSQKMELSLGHLFGFA
jgi:hypothetical protein